jgi:diketogulonate reductase-like aldo/keto reductase
MLQRNIPATGEALPALGLGTYAAFDVGSAPAAREPLRRVLQAMVDGGGSVVDSSPMYGGAEGVVGDLQTELKLRSKLFLATKVWTSGRDAGIRQIEESMRRLRTDTLDLLQIHNLLDWRTHSATLQQLKDDGRIRYAGITHYHAGAHTELEQVLRTSSFDFVQLNYSVAEREAEDRLLPLAQERAVAVIVNRPFAQSAMFSRVGRTQLPAWAAEMGCTSFAELFLKYVLSHPAVTCAIPATHDPAHLHDNLKAATGPLADASARRRIARYFDDL